MKANRRKASIRKDKIQIDPIQITEGFERRPRLVSAMNSLCKIAERSFNKLAEKYADCDIFGTIEIKIFGCEHNTTLVCFGRLCRPYAESNFYGNGLDFCLNEEHIIFFLPIGEEIMSVTTSIRLADEIHQGQVCEYFVRELEENIIYGAMESIPTHTEYYERLAKKAKSETAYSVIMRHDPIIFETESEFYCYGARYGFVWDDERGIFRQALMRARKGGFYVGRSFLCLSEERDH